MRDIGMIEQRKRLGLARESLPALGIIGEARRSIASRIKAASLDFVAAATRFRAASTPPADRRSSSPCHTRYHTWQVVSSASAGQRRRVDVRLPLASVAGLEIGFLAY